MTDLSSRQHKKELKNLGFFTDKNRDTFIANIITVNGRMTASQHMCIAEAAKLFGNGMIKISTAFTLEVEGIPYEKIDEFRKFIKKENLETGGLGAKIRPIVSCIGEKCKYGTVDTFKLSEEIQKRIYDKYKNIELPHRFKIAISGCNNDCTKISICELGIIAKLIFNKDNQEEKEAQYEYKIFIGGKGGRTKIHATLLNKIFTSKEEVFDLIEKAILFYIENGKPKERFASTVERIGFEVVEKQLFLNKL